MVGVKHFLDLDAYGPDALRNIIDRGLAFKQGMGNTKPLQGKSLVLIFEKPSTRPGTGLDRRLAPIPPVDEPSLVTTLKC